MTEDAEGYTPQPIALLDATYSPADYLEETVTLEGPDFTITIGEGRIEAVFLASDSLPDAEQQAAARRDVERVFKAALVMNERPWEMTDLTLKRRHPDGSREVWVTASTAVTLASAQSPDILITDENGGVVIDTRAQRLADARAFREQCLRHAQDPLLEELLASFRRAVSDAADCMTHLYEIRDALKRHFGDERTAKKALSISNAEWSDLGRIANDEPIEESRHRGIHPARHPSTEQQRGRVFDVARRMIRAYLDHLAPRS